MSQTGNGWSMGNSPVPPGGHNASPNTGAQSGNQDSAPHEPAPQQPQQPQYGQYSQYGQYGQAGQYGQYGSAPSAAPHAGQPHQPGGYGFAPKPGIIPLRALTLSDILDGAFAAMRSNPAVMFGFSFVFALASAALVTVAFLPFQNATSSFLSYSDPTSFTTVTNFEVVSSLSALMVYSTATTMLMGILVLPVGRAALGRVISFSQLWQQAKGRILSLFLLSVLITVLSLVASLAIMSPIFVLIGSLAGVVQNAGLLLSGALVLAIIGVLLSVFLTIRFSSAPAVLVLERATILQSFKRSWKLTAGSFWRIFGILVVASLITFAIITALQLALTIPLTAAFVFTLDGGADSYWPLLIISMLQQAISSALAIPFTAAVMSLVYIDLRIRKEGLDVDLAQAAAMEA